MKRYLYILFVAALLAFEFAACEPIERPIVYDEKIVVEGSIEVGEPAVVWLSRSLYVPYSEFGIEDVARIPIRLAKVAVSHAGREEVLVSRSDPDHILGWCYRGSEITGVEGGEYTLTVEYSGYTLTATTTIPSPARLGEVKFENGEMTATINNASPSGYYMLMARPAGKGVYDLCLFGTLEGASVGSSGSGSLAVFRPMGLNFEDGYNPNYGSGESVELRLASIDRPAFDYWSGFMGDVINAHNPLYPSSQNLPSNIHGGGLGVWYGFSASYGAIEIAE